MNLPNHRKYNWRIAYRNNRRAVWLSVSAILTGIMVVIGLWHASTNNDLASAEYRLSELRYDVAHAAVAWSMTATDFAEGTIDIEISKKPTAQP